MNRRRFFAAIVGGSVAPKVATSPHLASKPYFINIGYAIRAQQVALNRQLSTMTDILRSAPISAKQFRVPFSLKGPKP